MKIQLNGRPRELPGPMTVAAALEALGLRPEHVAVAVNQSFVPRARHREVTVADGDELEVLVPHQGG